MSAKITSKPVSSETPESVPDEAFVTIDGVKIVLASIGTATKSDLSDWSEKVGKSFATAMLSDDFETAKRLFPYKSALDDASATKSKKSDKPDKDFVGLVARRAAVLATASEMLAFGAFVPEGVPGDVDRTKITEAYMTIMRDPDKSVIEDAVALTATKVSKAANQNDVGAIIEHAFEDVPSGTYLTIRQICAKSDYPWDGAVSARLFPTKGVCTVDAVIPEDRRPSGGVKGAVKR